MSWVFKAIHSCNRQLGIANSLAQPHLYRIDRQLDINQFPFQNSPSQPHYLHSVNRQVDILSLLQCKYNTPCYDYAWYPACDVIPQRGVRATAHRVASHGVGKLRCGNNTKGFR